MTHSTKILICLSISLIIPGNWAYYQYQNQDPNYNYYQNQDPYNSNPYSYKIPVRPEYKYTNPGPGFGSGYLQCARIFASQNFQGRSLDFGSNDKRNDLWSYYIQPQSVQVRPGCSVTLFDHYGTKQTASQDNPSMWGWQCPISAACCQCDGCEGEAARSGLSCARLYEHDRCNGCDGYRLDFKHGDKVRDFRHLDNRMSSVAVRPGCQLISYYEPNFQGYRINLNQSINMFGENWNKHISSVECSCYDTPTVWPTVTLPTVPTIPTWPTYVYPTVTLPTVSTSPTWQTYWPTVTLPTVPTKPSTWQTWPTATVSTSKPWPTATLPTVPTKPTAPPVTWPTQTVTLPTITWTTVTVSTKEPTWSDEESESTERSSYSGEDGFGQSLTKTTETSVEDSENEDEDDWGIKSEEESTTTTTTTPKTTTRTTTTTPKPTTTTKTTTTTTKAPASESESEEKKNDFSDDDW